MLLLCGRQRSRTVTHDCSKQTGSGDSVPPLVPQDSVSHLHIGLSQIVCPLETGTWQMGFKCRRNLLKAFGTPEVFQIFGTASGRSRESSRLVLPFRLHESLQRSGPVTEPQHTGPPEPPARLPQAFKSPSSQSPTRHYMHCLFIQTSNIP